MDLHEDRVAEMVEEATKDQTSIICHSTLGENNAVCRGFFDQHKTQPLQIAERLGFIEWDETRSIKKSNG